MTGLAAAAARSALLGLVAHDTIVGMASLAPVRTAPAGPRDRRFRVVVPAHDEAHVVGDLLRDLQRHSYDRSLLRVVVLADRCSDSTAETARSLGFEAFERRDGFGSKGHALRWYLDRDPLLEDEALVVLDADNRVPPDLLAAFADELDRGAVALQAYLDVTNADDSLIASASALSYWAGNRMGQHGRQVLGLSPDLGGTGMCLSPDAVRLLGFTGRLSEDRDLALRLVLDGQRVTWLHHVHVADEKPKTLAVAVRQRARWRNGISQLQRVHLGPLLRLAVRGDVSALDQAVRLVRPSRTTTSILSVTVLAAQLAVRPEQRRWRLWLTVCTSQVVLPPVALLRDHVPARHVIRYPLALILPVLGVAARVHARRSRGRWVHTPHTGGGSGGARTSHRR